MSDLIFATPWWLLGTLVLVGGVVFWTGMKKQNNKPRAAGAGLILLALLLYSTRFFFESDKNRCEKQSLALVKSVETQDWPLFGSLLSDDVSLGTGQDLIYSNRQQVIDGARRNTEVYHPTNVSTRIANVEQDATGVAVDVDVAAESSASFGYRVPTSWKFSWQRSGNAWKLHEILCTKIGNQNGNEITHTFAR